MITVVVNHSLVNSIITPSRSLHVHNTQIARQLDVDRKHLKARAAVDEPVWI